MSNITLIIIAIVGIVLGYYLAKRKQCAVGGGTKQSKEKQENKQKILLALRDSNGDGKITNNDVEKLTGVTHSSAERYLDELEKEGKIIQNGNTGVNVFYTLK